MTEPTLTAIHHVSINVHDLDRSERWYTEVLQFSRLVEDAGAGFQRVLLHHPSDIALALNKYDHPDADMPFSERRTGLNHLAFQVADRGQLEAWIARFDALGVVHSEFKPAPIPGAFGIMFRDPDNIQLEVFAPAQSNP